MNCFHFCSNNTGFSPVCDLDHPLLTQQQTIFQEEVIVIDARVRDSTTNTVQDTADEVLKRLGKILRFVFSTLCYYINEVKTKTFF